MGVMPGTRSGTRDIELAYAATREILRARDAAAAKEIVLKLCIALGAEVTSAEDDDGRALPIDLSLGEGDPLLPVSDDEGVRYALTRYLVPAVSDARTVVERGLSSERLVENATRDALTGLWSRRALSIAVNRSRPGDCIAMLDIDHFKAINDTLGHEAGDTVLVAFSAHLRAGVRTHDIVGRLGGEEFVILFPHTPIDEARSVLERLRQSWPAVSPQHVTFSAGLTVVPDLVGRHELAGQASLKVADELMYQAKSAGRDLIIAGTSALTEDRS